MTSIPDIDINTTCVVEIWHLPFSFVWRELAARARLAIARVDPDPLHVGAHRLPSITDGKLWSDEVKEPHLRVLAQVHARRDHTAAGAHRESAA